MDEKTKRAIQRIEDLPEKDRQELHEWLDNLDRIAVTMVIDDKPVRLFFNKEEDADSFVVVAEKSHNVQVAFKEI